MDRAGCEAQCYIKFQTRIGSSRVLRTLPMKSPSLEKQTQLIPNGVATFAFFLCLSSECLSTSTCGASNFRLAETVLESYDHSCRIPIPWSSKEGKQWPAIRLT